jgi:hypothetical protein
MKKFLFLRNVVIAIACLAVVNGAYAQDHSKRGSAPHYCEEYLLYKRTLQSKIWWSGQNMRSENNPGVVDAYGLKNDKRTIYIYRADSAKFYCIWPDEKKMMVFNPEQINTNSFVGLNIETSNVQTKEMVGIEEVDGKKCQHWSITTKSKLQVMGQEGSETSCYDYWYYEPWKMPIQEKNGCGFIEPLITLNVQFGPQPDELFAIPKDYQVMVLPTGGLMEMITGKGKAENQKDVDNAQQEVQKGMNEINKKMEDYKKNTEGKSDAEKLQEALKMLGGSTKKK